MERTPGDKEVIYFGELACKSSEQPATDELVDRMRGQLESALQRLVRSVNTLVYTRNPVALAVTAQQCDRVEQLLDEMQALDAGQQASGGGRYRHALEALLFTEAENLLAEARRLVSAPLKPLRRGDNVIVLKPDYADLADAAFERMLASSDIPQLLSGTADWDEQIDFAPPAATPRQAPTLTLVHSSDVPARR
ncbi:MAG: hypothetical protein WBN40_12980 [Pseudomonadales bacterium]